MSAPVATRLRVDQLLSRFGYCSRRDALAWLRHGRVQWAPSPPPDPPPPAEPLTDPAQRVDPAAILVDGQPIEGPAGLLAMLHKPLGFVCSHSEKEGPTIYDLLPQRWPRRNPAVSSVGRLDRESTGLLLLTDVGPWLHRWTSPRWHVEKTYEVTVEGSLAPDLIPTFASGTLLIEGDPDPCLPARLEILSPDHARVHLTEGRFRQIRRMFAAVGLRVLRLHRSRFGPYTLDDLPEGSWRLLPPPRFE